MFNAFVLNILEFQIDVRVGLIDCVVFLWLNNTEVYLKPKYIVGFLRIFYDE